MGDDLKSRLEEAINGQCRLNARIALLEEALRFYAEQWEQDVDAERTISGWVGSIGEVMPTQELIADFGQKARAALSNGKGE